jgi:hypothetical protein
MSLAHNPSRGLNGAFLKGQSRYVDVRCASDESGVLVGWRDQTNPDYRSDITKYPIQVLSVGDGARVAEAVFKMIEHFLGSYPLDSVITQIATQTTTAAASARGTSSPSRAPSMSELAEQAERFGVHLRELERLRMQIGESQAMIEAARNVINSLLSDARRVDIKLQHELYPVELVDVACSLIVGARPSFWSVRRYSESLDAHAYSNDDAYNVFALHKCEWVLSARIRLGVNLGVDMVVSVEPLLRYADRDQLVQDLARERMLMDLSDPEEEQLDKDTYLDMAERDLHEDYPSWGNQFPLSGDPARDLEVVCANILAGLDAMPVEQSFYSCDDLDGEVRWIEDELRSRGVLQ